MLKARNYFLGFIGLWLLFCWGHAIGTEQPPALRTTQLLEIQRALESAETELQALKRTAAKTTEEQSPDLFAELRKQNEAVANLRLSLEKTATGGLSIQALNVAAPPFDWRQEMSNVMQPVLESLKQLTHKPRQTTELRTGIKRLEEQLKLLDNGLTAIAQEKASVRDKALNNKLQDMQDTWQQEVTDLLREKVLLETELATLQRDDADSWQSLTQSLESFFAGRALTLLLAILFAVGTWLLFRLVNQRLWQRHASRRSSPLYRFFMYSFHAFSTIFIVLVVFAVFYLRDDVLLLGLGLLVMVAGLLGLQKALPRFLREVNLLLNLGSAREGERLLYNGVPYCVQSLNVFTILSNPALEGVRRLPLEQIATLFSRPVLANEPWFPCAPGDVLLLPDEMLVTVEQQSIEQVVLKSLGGALVHYNTADFFGLSLVNLSRSGSFVVSTVFGLDYRYQANILEAYPALIMAEIPKALSAAQIDAALYSSMSVEFKTANASSLDLLIWVTFDSQLAASFRKLERILQQACLRVCNQHNLTIPFPQLSIHVENQAA